MAGLTPQLSAADRTEWAERILAENNQTQLNRDIILGHIQHTGADRTRILRNNQDLICAYLILAMNEMTPSRQIVNPVTGRFILLDGTVYNRLLNDCNLRATRTGRTSSRPATPQQQQAVAEIQEVLGNLPEQATHDQRNECAERILDGNINPNILLTDREYREQLNSEFMMSDAHNTTQIIRERIDTLRQQRRALTHEQLCAYFILSN